MRHCVLRHHVCLCVLSTAMLAGFALLTDQREVYAASLNCKEVANGMGQKGRIECDGSSGTRTGRVGTTRTIDMGKVMGTWGMVDNSGHPAVKVYNRANIRITGDVTITDSGKNIYPAIKVYSEGVLTVNNVTMSEVHKGIEADGKGSIVTVNQGKIEVRADGVSVIEVKGGGEVMLGRGVTVNGGGGAKSTGIVVGNGGGNVMVMTKSFTGVNKGIVFKGTGTANVSGRVGGGTMMTVEKGGVGIMMERTATGTANVMNMTVKGQNSGTGVDMKNGMLELNKVGVSNFTTGAQVSDGMLTVMGKSMIEVTGSNGVGLSVMGGGTASVMNAMITGAIGGSGKTGVLMEGEKTVTLSGVTVSNFATGISVTGEGTVTVMGKSEIKGSTMGVSVEGGEFVAFMSKEGKIEVQAGGTGLKVTGAGIANVMNAMITASGGAGVTGVEMKGSKTVTLNEVTVSNFATGISVTGEGTVTVMGKSEIKGKSVGVEVKGNGVFRMTGDGVESMIAVTEQSGTGVGLKVMDKGTATVMGTTIMASGGGGTGKIGVESSGTVTLTGVKIEKFETGISVTGGKLTVMGSSRIEVTTGTGLKVTEQGTANVMNTAIMASGGAGVTGVEVNTSGGKGVTLDGVTVTEFKTGISVKSGEVKVSGNSTIKGKSVGVSVTGGTFMMEGAESGIMVEANGTGLKVMEQGVATVMNTTITAQGGSGTGKIGVESSGTVTLTDVKIERFEKGVYMTKGKFKMTGGSIKGNGVTGKVGVYAASGTVTLEGGVEISGFTTGVSVENGTLTISGGKITGTGGSGTGVEVNTLGGKGVMLDGVKIEKFEKGISVTSGKLTVNGGSIKGENKGYGVYALGGEVMMTEVKISQVGAGVYMTGDGTLTIKKGTEIELASGGEYGVYVGKDVKSASLNDVKIIGGGSGTGVYALGGEVTLEGVVKISQVETGVYMMGDGTLTMTGGTEIELASGGEYGVYVGALVTKADLKDVTIRGQNKGTGVYALGAETMTMTLTGVKISNVDKGVYARGKVVTISGGTRIEGVKEYGVYVEGAVTSVNLNDVKIRGKGSGSRYGVYAASGTVTMTEVKISEVEMGIVVSGGQLTIKKGTEISLASGGRYGVYVGEKVTKATLTETVIKGKGSGKGVYVEGYGNGKTGEVKLEGVTISKVTTGVEVKSGKSLMISGNSTISFTGDYGVGVIVGDGVKSANLNNVTIRGESNNGYGGTGVHAMGEMMMISGGEISNVTTGVEVMRGTLMINRVNGKNSTINFVGDGVGVKVGDGVASASLSDVTIKGNGVGGTGIHAMGKMMMISGGEIKEVKTGVHMEGKGTLTMTGGTKINLARGGDYGVYVKNTAMTKLTGTVITGQNKGTGVYAVGMTGNGELTMELALTDVTISNVGTGVEVKSGKSLMISGNSTISLATGGKYGVHAIGGDVMLDKVEIKGGGMASTGVEVWGGKEVMLTNVGISNVGKGVSMMSGNSLTISGDSSVISFVGNGVGVKVEGDVKRADLNNVTIRGENRGYGVYAKGTEEMVLTEVKIEGVKAGVYAEKGMLTIEKGTRIELADGGKYGVYVGVSVTRADLDDVMIRGGGSGSEYGVYAVGTGVVMLDGVGISQVGAGVVMMGDGTLTISGERSVISFMGDGDYGVGVGVGKDVKSANLKDVTIRGEGGSGRMGVHAMGGEVTLDKVKIEEVETGVVMEGDGTLTMNKGTTIELARGGRYGVYVEGAVTSANLNDVTIRGGGIGSTGVYAMGTTAKNGALTMTMAGVRISNVQMGITMKRGESLTMIGDSTINFMGGYGVKVEGGVMAELTGTTIKGENRGSGTGVIMESSGKMMLEDVKIEGIMTGVYAENGELEIKGKTEIEFAKNGWGVVVGNKVTRATLDDVTITGKGGSGSMGVYVVGYGMGAVGGGGDVTLEKVRIEGVETGVSMVWGKSLTISGGSIAKVKTGVSVKNGGMLTVKEGTTISFVEDYGVYVGGGVMAKLIGTTIKGEGMGKMGVYVEETGVVELNMVTTEGVETGVAMTRSGMLVISGDSTINFVGDYGVYVKNTAMVELAKTRIIGQNSGRGGNNGVKYGVYATGGDVTMTLNDVRIEEVKTGITMLGGGLKVMGGSIKGVTTGIAMSGSGTLMVEDKTTIQFTKGYGVMVGGGVTVGERVMAKLTETTIRGEGKGSTGVYVAGGDALLEQVKIEGSNQATGLYVTQGAVRLKNTTLRDVAMGMTISQGVVMMEGGELEFTDRYGVSVSGGQAVLSGFKIIKKGNEDTDKSTGVWVDNSGKVMMREVDISGVQMGAYVMETGLLVMDKGSIDFKGEYSIYTSLQNSPLNY